MEGLPFLNTCIHMDLKKEYVKNLPQSISPESVSFSEGNIDEV